MERERERKKKEGKRREAGRLRERERERERAGHVGEQRMRYILGTRRVPVTVYSSAVTWHAKKATRTARSVQFLIC